MIRPARPEDAEPLSEIDARVVSDGRGVVRSADNLASADDYRRRIAGHAEPNGLFVVAEVEGHVVGEGTIQRMSFAYSRHVAFFALQVDPGSQGRGVGRAISDALIAWSDAHEVERLQLLVRADNHRAIRLYRSLGFATEGMRVGMLRLPGGERGDDLIMTRFQVAHESERVAAAIVRRDRGAPEILVFAHPEAGWQLPKGRPEPGEDLADALLREVAEETGVAAREPSPLGTWTQLTGDGRLQRWHGFLVDAPEGLPDRWEHAALGSPEEERLELGLRWARLAEVRQVLPPVFHEVVARAIDRLG